MQQLNFLKFFLINFILFTSGFRCSFPSRQLSVTQSKFSKSLELRSIADFKTFSSFNIADGLDADTLNALGDIQQLDEAIDNLEVQGGPAIGDIVTNAVASPAILLVPILAGGLVAFAVGFFIYKYSQGSEA
jgi:hypothetical protein